jgi:amino acid transporter
MMMGPRFLYALAADGYGPKVLAHVHPRFRTPAAAILCQGIISLLLALSGSFVQLALLSMTTRLFAYIGTAAAVLVLAKRYADRPGALKLPGGPLIPVLALVLCVALFASASWANILAALAAFAVGAVIYLFPRKGGRDSL